jgi:mannosyltransferase OCH1-like enzyme
MIQKIDFAKYLILYKYGGIYVDMDIKCLKSINNTPEINNSDIILSVCPLHLLQILSLHIFGTLEFKNKKVVNNGIIMCIPNNNIILLTMKEVYKHRNFHSIFNFIHVFSTTGPATLTNSLNIYKKQTNPEIKYKIKILDTTYFENCDIIKLKNNDCKIPNHAIGIHYYESSWVSANESKIIILYRYLIKYWYLFILLIAIIILGKASISKASISKASISKASISKFLKNNKLRYKLLKSKK